MIRLHATEMLGATFYTLLELANEDLSSFLKRNRYFLGVDTICAIWRSLLSCVEAVHARNIIHFDLKPQVRSI